MATRRKSKKQGRKSAGKPRKSRSKGAAPSDALAASSMTFTSPPGATRPAPALPAPPTRPSAARAPRSGAAGASGVASTEPKQRPARPAPKARPAPAARPARPAPQPAPAQLIVPVQPFMPEQSGKLSMAQIYETLAALLVPYARRMESEMHPKIGFCLKSRSPKTGREVHFGGVQAQPDGVSYHLFPLYAHPDLLQNVSPELHQRMRGQTCFHFEYLHAGIVAELAELTHAGFERFLADGQV